MFLRTSRKRSLIVGVLAGVALLCLVPPAADAVPPEADQDGLLVGAHDRPQRGKRCIAAAIVHIHDLERDPQCAGCFHEPGMERGHVINFVV